VAAGASPPGVARGWLSTILLPGEALVDLVGRGGAVGSPRWVRMLRTVTGAVMKAMIRIAPPQVGHTSGSTS
jgi:hypothetical protein